MVVYYTEYIAYQIYSNIIEYWNMWVQSYCHV
jgi:hypothetical protein